MTAKTQNSLPGGGGVFDRMAADLTIDAPSIWTNAKLRGLLQRYRSGKLAEDALLRELRDLPFGELGDAKVDHHRALRCGFPEVIYSRGKTVAQIVRIAREILPPRQRLLATRATPETYRAIRKIDRRAVWHDSAAASPSAAGPRRGRAMS